MVIVGTIAALQLFAEVYAMYFRGRRLVSATRRASISSICSSRPLSSSAWVRLGDGVAVVHDILIITAIQIKFSKRWVYYEGETG